MCKSPVKRGIGMRILALESSCDETAAAVVEDGRRILSNVVATQIERHKIFGGVVPEIASRLHAESISAVTAEALEQAGMTLAMVDAIAVTYAPGLIGALLVGVNYAKGLALGSGKPLVPVHHLRAHIAANYITHRDLEPPFLCLVVSGGNTLLVQVKDYTEFQVLGRTRDDAAGEALDKAARAMGLLEEPRYILKAVCNNFVEMPENTIREQTFCCGSGSGLNTEEIMELRMRAGMPRGNALRYVQQKYDVNHMACVCAIDRATLTPLANYWAPGVTVSGLHELVGNALIMKGEQKRTMDLRQEDLPNVEPDEPEDDAEQGEE